MHHSSFAPRLLAMSLLAASALSVSAFAAPVSSSTAIRVDRDPTTNASSSVTASTDSPVTVDPSQASGQIKVVYQDANGVERTATIAAVAAQAENYARVTTNGDTLRVRQGPGTNYGILCSVEDGDTFPITGKTNGWYQILCNGRTGYVSAQYAKVENSDQVSKPDPDDNAATNPEGNSIVSAEPPGHNGVYSSCSFARKCALISSGVSQPSVSPERRPLASSFISCRVAWVFS